MNRIVTSREQLLKAAKEIAYQDGLEHVNIRAVAGRCHVSVGSIYNYFPTKADLMFSIAEDFWDRVFSGEEWRKLPADHFVDYCEGCFKILSEKLSVFEKSWLVKIQVLGVRDKQKGRELELKWFNYMIEEILKALNTDGRVKQDIWNENFTKEEFSRFIFQNIMNQLRQGIQEFRFLRSLLDSLLY